MMKTLSMNWVMNKHIPPFKLSKRFWFHLARYSIIGQNREDQPYWMTRVECCYFHLTREGLANG